MNKTSAASDVQARILLTGGAGYIGAHVSQALLAQQIPHVIVDDLSTGLIKNVNQAVPFYQSDIRDQKSIADIINQHDLNTLIHLAGSIKVDESIINPMLYYKNNVANTLTLLETISKTQRINTFHFSSTAAIYGDQTEHILAEDAPCQPNSAYGWSKYFAERVIVDVCQQFNISYKILRFFNVAGIAVEQGLSFTTGNADSVLRTACRSLLSKDHEFTIFGNNYPTLDGTCIRDFIHVQDLADIHLHLLAVQGEQNMILNCGYGKGISIQQIADKIQHIGKGSLKIIHGSRRTGDIYQAVANVDVLMKQLGWQPKFDSLDVMIEQTLAWERLHYGEK